MSSGRTRLFLTIEKLKNAMDDTNMAYPFWEKFFPLLGSATSISLDVSMLGELINEAAETAEQLILTQGGAIFSQHVQGGVGGAVPRPTVVRGILQPLTTTATPAKFDDKKYHTQAEKLTSYLVSASLTSTMFTVKDVVKMYLYTFNVPKYKPLFEVLEQTLFRKEKECVPVVSAENTSLILDNLRDLTTITNYRLDQEAMTLMLTNLHRALNNELSKLPHVKVKEYIPGTGNVYEKEVKPYKALADKFELLVAQKTSHYVVAADNKLTFSSNPFMVENVAAVIEKNCDMNRMVYNSINNIFINAVEQSAAENIKFDSADYNKRFKILERVRENSQSNFVDKVAVGDVITRKRTKTADTLSIQPPISLKKNRVSTNSSK
ncbi:p40 [Clostera anachoreta granulovirus]|uniref:p40 n=1 Tax=Clostera anachoreta granulovirus TaxID=283675 RepID=F4ZKU7_9BBAC|nr:p40 [Clostera anachoreta granulovirus]AEB00358.1 p40 [Clostera anachoreta granulovirus]